MARIPNPVRKRGRIIILILFAVSLLLPALMTLFGAVAPWTDTGTLDIDGVRTISVYPGYLEKDSSMFLRSSRHGRASAVVQLLASPRRAASSCHSSE